MPLLRPTLLAFAVMIVFLAVAMLYTIPNRPPDQSTAKYEFLRLHRDVSIESVERDGIADGVLAFRIRYRPFASNQILETVPTYRQTKTGRWEMD